MSTNWFQIEKRKPHLARSLRRLLAERVGGAVEKQHEQPDARIAELLRQLDEKESADL